MCDIEKKINDIIYEVLANKITYEDIKPDKNLIADLCADSSEILEIILTLTVELNVDIKVKDVENILQIENMYVYIAKKLSLSPSLTQAR